MNLIHREAAINNKRGGVPSAPMLYTIEEKHRGGVNNL